MRTTSWILSVIGVLLVGAVGLTACGGSAKSSQDLLYDIRAYNEGLRWDKLPQAAVRVPPKERDAFLDEREALRKDLRIDDFELTRLTMKGDSHERAEVQVRWTWHLETSGVVHTTTSQQRWQRYGDSWLMLREEHLRGDPMPGLAEAEDEDGEDQAEEEAGEEVQPIDSKASLQVEAALRTAEKTHTIAE